MTSSRLFSTGVPAAAAATAAAAGGMRPGSALVIGALAAVTGGALIGRGGGRFGAGVGGRSAGAGVCASASGCVPSLTTYGIAGAGLRPRSSCRPAKVLVDPTAEAPEDPPTET